MTHVLVVEDDPLLRRSLALNLTARGYTCDETGNGEDALKIAGRSAVDVVFVDLGLPSISGLDVIVGLRRFTDIPIIVLSARGAEADKVAALDAGANDYVTKPFGVEEVMARLRAAERVSAVLRRPERVVRADGFTVDLDTRRVWRETIVTGRAQPLEEVHLTPIEWGILSALAAEPERVVPYRRLLAALWGESEGADAASADTASLRVHVTHLRRKLEVDPRHPVHVLTEPGVGYRLVLSDSGR